MRRSILAVLGVGVVVLGGFLVPRLGATASVDPADFASPRANPYFPLRPGTLYVLRGSEDGERLREHAVITDKTKVILGVSTTVVRDTVWANGRLVERTLDWYANDNDGTTWYFGERTAAFNAHEEVINREGSWQAGIDGARPGIIMPHDPSPTDAYRQEFFAGHAEDQAWVVQRDLRITVPYGTVEDVVRTFEWARLEPHVVSQKLYAPGLGIVRETDVAGGTEDLQLVAVRKV